MTRVATNRLMEATATLPPADRALVNLWVNRGLDDTALAGLLGISEETIASRRARIVEHLSSTLGLPPDHVHAALSEIRVASRSPNGDAAVPGRPVGEAEAPTARTTSEAAAARTAAEAPAARTAAGLEAVPAPRRRRRLWWALGLTLVAIAAVCILVVSLASSGRPGQRRRPTAADKSTHTVPASGRGSTTRGSGGDLLTALPGTPGHASGSVAISHSLRLSLTVRNLPPASGGHYEVWLYNSLTVSVPLGRLRAGVDHLSLPLPRGAARYRWIDISFQPVGAVFDSGESVLRAANPRFGRSGP